MANNEFWDRRVQMIDVLLVRTKQEPLTEQEGEQLKQSWEETFKATKVVDPTQVGTLLNDLISTTKVKLEEFKRVWHGRSRLWA